MSCALGPHLATPSVRRDRNRCRAVGSGHGANPSPEELMRRLAADNGVRVITSRRGAEEEDSDDDESWDDAVSELGNPWDMRPAKVGLLDEDLLLGPDPAAESSPASPAGGSASPYLDPSALSRIDRQELLDLIRGPGGAGGAGGGMGGRAMVAMVDVREAAEAGSRAAPADAAALPGALTLHIPLASLRRAEAERLEAAADYVVVLATGDHRAEQAVIRMTKVYGLRRVMLYDGTSS